MSRHYSKMPYSQRVLFTATMFTFGFGYLFALVNIFETYAGRAGGNPMMLTYQDIVVGYSGSGNNSILESALGNSMSEMLPQEERAAIIAWLRSGATSEVFANDVRPILANRCIVCHDNNNPHIPNLSGYENVRNLTLVDTGPSSARLVLGSHIHLFGIGFIFFIMGLMFSHAHVRPVWFKCAVIALPFIATALDIGSWYLVKLYNPFAWVVIGSGATMAACFAFMWVVTMYQLWLYKPQ